MYKLKISFFHISFFYAFYMAKIFTLPFISTFLQLETFLLCQLNKGTYFKSSKNNDSADVISSCHGNHRTTYDSI